MKVLTTLVPFWMSHIPPLLTPAQLLARVLNWDAKTAQVQTPKLDRDAILYLGRHLEPSRLAGLIGAMTQRQRIWLNKAYGVHDCGCDNESGLECRHYAAARERDYTLPWEVIHLLIASIVDLDEGLEDDCRFD